MCGIFGLTKKKSFEFINKFKNNLDKRGPDDFNFYVDDNVTLLHNRLSILDLTKGKQPMKFEDLVIIYNGEIFNSPNLRKSLIEKGYNFFTDNSDTEVILKLYHLKGSKMLNDLNGMFSFVIYDQKKKKLFGAVDKHSIKPLYYTYKNNEFAFASEVRPLLKLENISKDISKQNLNYYFNLQYSPSNLTMYEDIKKIENSSFFEFDIKNKKFEINKYTIENKQNYFYNSYFDVIKAGQEAIEKSVENWMLSDVEVACSLSGGLDSSIIASIQAMKTNKKIKTISVGFENEDFKYDETKYANRVAKYIQSDHEEIKVNSNLLLDDLESIINYLAEPYAGSLASWFIYKNLKDKKVIFTGTGADELFGNYGKWKLYSLSEIFFKNLLDAIIKQDIKYFKNFYGFTYKKILYQKQVNKLIKSNVNNQIDISEIIQKISSQNKNLNAKKRIQEIDHNLQLPWEFLYITDRLSMMNSVEARTPYLDNEMLSFISKIKPKYYGNILNSKKILKDIAKKYIPEDIISRKKKGFTLPKDNWLRSKFKHLFKHYCSKEFILNQNLFNLEEVDKIFIEFQKKPNNINTEKAWTLFIFQFWYEKNYSSY